MTLKLAKENISGIGLLWSPRAPISCGFQV